MGGPASRPDQCPLEKADPDCEICAAGRELRDLRTTAAGMLHQLATHAAGAAAPSCCDAACSRETQPVAKTSCDDASCCANQGCPIRIASRLGALQASWALADREAAAMSAAARTELHASFAKLAATNPAISLVPQSVAALAEGFERLHEVHTKMGEWAQANAELMASMPESGRMTFMMQVALVDEARGVLNGVTRAMGTLHGETASTALKTTGN